MRKTAVPYGIVASLQDRGSLNESSEDVGNTIRVEGSEVWLFSGYSLHYGQLISVNQIETDHQIALLDSAQKGKTLVDCRIRKGCPQKYCCRSCDPYRSERGSRFQVSSVILR